MADTDIDAVRKQKKAEYDKQRHIHDPVLSSLEMEGIRHFYCKNEHYYNITQRHVPKS
jgi:hypothetical protein